MSLQDYFLRDGKTRPWYGLLTYPASIHVSSTNVTWASWESFLSGSRILKVATLDHDTDVWTSDVGVGSHPLHNDDHGVPSLCRDADGFVHCFGGGHDSDVFEWVTNAADNPAAWTLRTTFNAGDFAYPRPVLVSSTMYLFLREKDVGAFQRRLVLYKTTSIVSGVPTWGARQNLVEFGSNSRVYTSNPILDGTDIHLSAVFADYADTARIHQYYFILDTTTGAIRNADGSVSVASGSLPISLATANASFRVVSTPVGSVTQVAAHCLDASGDPHLVYLEHATGSSVLKHTTFNGTSWSSPATIVTLADDMAANSSCLVANADGSIDLYYDEDDAKVWVTGGNIRRLTRSSGGSWGSSSLILSATSYALGNPSVVHNGHANARVVFAELTVGDSDSSGGNLRGWAYGDAGFFKRDFAVGPIPPVEDPDPHWANVKLLLQGRP